MPNFDEYTLEYDQLDPIHMQVKSLLEKTEVENIVSDHDGTIIDKYIG